MSGYQGPVDLTDPSIVTGKNNPLNAGGSQTTGGFGGLTTDDVMRLVNQKKQQNAPASTPNADVQSYQDVIARLTGNKSATAPAATSPENSAPVQATTPPASSGQFIENITPEVQRVAAETGLDPRIIAAQTALETGYGAHAPGNNYFGIKGSGGSNLPTREFVNGQWVNVNAGFAGYPTMSDSFTGYANFLKNNPRYQPLLQTAGKSLEEQAAALGKSGYATDPNYGDKVLSIAKGMKAFPSKPQKLTGDNAVDYPNIAPDYTPPPGGVTIPTPQATIQAESNYDPYETQ